MRNTTYRWCNRSTLGSQRGFTLVELMVSITIGMLIALALMTMLISVNRNNTEMTKANRIIENGRFALKLLEADVSHAGYWAGHLPEFDDLALTIVPTDAPTAVPNPCKAYADWTATDRNNLVGIGIQPYSLSASVPTSPFCSSLMPNAKIRTDALFVRHADTCVPGVGQCAALSTGEVLFQSSRCASAVTSFVLSAAGLDLQNRDCATVAEVRRFVSNLYYVRDYAVTAGDGIPTLMRSQFGLSGTTPQHLPAQPMIHGIEGFRVVLGIDNVSDSGAAVNFGQTIAWADAALRNSPTNRGDGIPDGAYVRCPSNAPCTAAQLMNTVAVQVFVLVRAEQPTPGYTDTKVYDLGLTTLGPFNDPFKRHLFQQTVRLVNVASRRETP